MKGSTTTAKITLLKNAAIALFWLIVWQLAHMAIGRDIYVPSPFVVFAALWDLMQTQAFWVTVYHSMLRVLIGLLLSLAIGLSFGIFAGLSPFVYAVFNPLMGIIKSTPVISFIIIALIWFKSTHVPIFIAFLMCFPVIWTNTVSGIRHVDPKLLQMAKVYHVPKRHILTKVYLPSLMPYVSAAVITTLGLGWKVSVAAEVLSHPRHAIGSDLHSAKTYLDTPSLFAWTLVVIVLSLIFESLFAKLIQNWTKRRRYQ